MMDDDYSHTSGEADGRQPHRTKRRNTAIGLFRRPRNNYNYNSTSISTPFLHNNNDLNRSKHPTPRGDSSSYNCNSSATENTSLTSGWFDSSHSSSLLTPASLDIPPKEQLIGLPSFIVEIPPIPALDDVSCMMERDDDDSTRTASTRTTTATTPVRPLLAIRRYISPSNR